MFILLLTVLCSVVLAVILVIEGLRGQRLYLALKADVDANVPNARVRFYQQTIRFEVITGGLAAAVLALHRGLSQTGLEELPMLQRFAVMAHAGADFWSGFLTSFTVGVLGAWLIIRLRKPSVKVVTPSKWLPDFDAMLPRSGREGRWFALVAISAGVCEELVFRGWLLQVLTQFGGLHGTVLLAVAALSFGVMHAYQGPVGVITTTLLAVTLIGITVMTGSLLIPMVMHVIIDLRWALPKPSAKLAPPTAAT